MCRSATRAGGCLKSTGGSEGHPSGSGQLQTGAVDPAKTPKCTWNSSELCCLFWGDVALL